MKKLDMSLREYPSTFKCVSKSNLIGVFKVDAHWDAASKSAHDYIDASVVDVALQEERCRLAFYAGVGCDD